MPFNTLLQKINEIIEINKEEEAFLLSGVSIKKLRRRQYLLQEGDVCKHYNYINKGCLRMYKIDEQGAEHNLQFATEGWWIADISSFHNFTPSLLNIDALETTEVVQIPHAHLIAMYTTYPVFERFFRVTTENALIALQHRLLQTISVTAEERYLYFIDKYPQFIDRIPQVQIASYLGVTPQFLSKIRSKLATKNRVR